MAQGQVTQMKPRWQRVGDALQNLLSGLGVIGKDKSVHTTFTFNLLSDDQLTNAYRGDWMARKIVDIPADDATRAWRDWQADEEQISLLEAEERRLDLRGKLREAMQGARLYGGSVVFMGIRNDPPMEPLDPTTIKKGDIKFIHPASRITVSAQRPIDNLMDEFYGEPEYYEVTGTDVGTVRVHPSRCVRLLGARLPDKRMATSSIWGDSVLQVCEEALKQAGMTLASVSTMVQEATVDVISVPNLIEGVTNPAMEEKFISRFVTAAAIKSTTNALLLDKEETWERISQNFAGLPDIARLFLLVISGAADIPATRFLGQSPVGMNSTGESDLHNYYDKISSEQNTILSPALARLDDVLIRSALGDRPDEIFYNWAPLWQMTEKEHAEIAKSKAEAFRIDVESGIIPLDALREGRQNQLIEDGTYPGFEGALRDSDAEPDLDENDPQVQEQFSGETITMPAQQALQGPQIAAAREIITAVIAGDLPRETAEKLLALSFPFLSSTDIKAMMAPLDTFAAEKKAERETRAATLPQPGEQPPAPNTPPQLRVVQGGQQDGGRVVRINLAGGGGFTREQVRSLIADLDKYTKLGARVELGDMTPRPLYVYRKLLNAAEVRAWAKSQGFATALPPDDMHVTVVYSKASVDWFKLGEPYTENEDGGLVVRAGGPRSVEQFGDRAVVLQFASAPLAWRHQDAERAGASYDYDEYLPHVTITYEAPADMQIANIVPYKGELRFGPEIFEPIVPNGFDPDTVKETAL